MNLYGKATLYDGFKSWQYEDTMLNDLIEIRTYAWNLQTFLGTNFGHLTSKKVGKSRGGKCPETNLIVADYSYVSFSLQLN